MIEKIVSASNLKATVIHKPDNPKRRESWEWLDGLLSSGNQNQIPPIVVIQDPKAEECLIYDGNIRVAHALQNGYSLRTWIIENQSDLDKYLSKNPAYWFDIRNFSTLLKFMRLYAANPKEGSEIDPEIAEFLTEKEKAHYGWHSDE